MIAFIDDQREAHGVEPICKVLPIAPSTYHDHVAKRTDPAKLSARAKREGVKPGQACSDLVELPEIDAGAKTSRVPEATPPGRDVICRYFRDISVWDYSFSRSAS